MSHVTSILSKIEFGDSSAAAELLPLVYNELRKLAAAKLANERSDHSLQATALVHEAYLRLIGDGKDEPSWDEMERFGYQSPHRNTARLMMHFDAADKDHNGLVTQEEIDAYRIPIGNRAPPPRYAIAFVALRLRT